MANAQAAHGDHDAIDPPIDEQVEIRRLAIRIVGGVAQQKHEPVLPGDVLDSAHELREERVFDVGDDEPEGLGRPQLQRAGDRRRPVVERAGRVQDALTRIRPRPAEAGQHPADRRGRDAGATRDVTDRRGHVDGCARPPLSAPPARRAPRVVGDRPAPGPPARGKARGARRRRPSRCAAGRRRSRPAGSCRRCGPETGS